MRRFLFILVPVFIVSCNQIQRPSQSYQDQVLQKYFAMVDSSGQYDTSDSHFQMLRAYANNDTALLKNLDSTIVSQNNNRANWDLWTSDIPLPQLKKLNAEEAYRFISSKLGTPSYEVVTLYKKDTLFKLEYLQYSRDKENLKFYKGKQFEKSISRNQWDKLIDLLQEADYWGLKGEKNVRGDDGGDLTLLGYRKSSDGEKTKYVHRWLTTTLTESYFYVYQKLIEKKDRK